MPEPLILPSGGVEDEQYEGVLIKLLNVQCVNDTAFGMWMVDDGTGIALIHNSSTYGHPYVIGEFYDITGPLNYDFDQFKIELRSADDVEAGTDNLAPIILSAAPVTPTLVYVNFNESVELNSAQDVNNYSINNGIIISNALRHSFDFKKVILTVSELQSNSYTLSVNNIEDFSGNIMTLTEVQFSYLGMNEQTNEQIAIFPNPSNGIISLNLRDETGASDIGVFDLSGRLLEYYQYENKRMQIDLSHLPNGVYFLKVESDQKKFVSKISIVK